MQMSSAPIYCRRGILSHRCSHFHLATPQSSGIAQAPRKLFADSAWLITQSESSLLTRQENRESIEPLQPHAPTIRMTIEKTSCHTVPPSSTGCLRKYACVAAMRTLPWCLFRMVLWQPGASSFTSSEAQCWTPPPRL